MLLKLFSIGLALLLAAAVVIFVILLAVRRRTLPSERPKRLKPYIIAVLLCLIAAAGLQIGSSIYKKNIKPADMGNPFFTGWDTPFGAPPFDRLAPEHFDPAFREGMRIQRAEVDSIVANPDAPTFDNTILALDRSGEVLNTVSKIFFALTSAETNERMEKIKAEMSPLLSQHGDRIGMNLELFERIKSVYERRAEMGLNEAQARLLQRTYDRFVRNGALLDDEQKAELAKINEELSLLSVRFGNNRREAINAFRMVIGPRDATGLPQNVVSAAREKARAAGFEDKLLFTLHKPSLLPFLTYSDREDLRRELYTAYLELCAEGTEFDNTGIIKEIVALRIRKAHLLGFESFAAYVLAERMALEPSNVYALLDDIWAPALEKAKEERGALLEIRRKDADSTAVINSWDWWYYAEKVRKERYSFDEEQARPYLSLGNVRTGIFNLCNRLYGITFRPLKLPVYHKDVSVYEVLDKDNSHLGLLYMDFHPRPGKNAGAWCGSFRNQGYDRDGNRIAPITTIVCNFTEPVAGSRAPALLTLDETETFFHEFGHALHNLFANVPYEGLLGVERDFVELPSQIMENWAFEPELLKSYALHYRTGDPMPDRIIQRMGESKLFNEGFNTVELIAASFLDMDIHTLTETADFNVSEFERFALTDKRGLIPEIEPRYRLPYFSHIFNGGYAAGYYGYIWAEVLDKDAYEMFVESGDLFNREIARDFRQKILAPRGLKKGMDLYIDFRGRGPDRTPLFRARGLLSEPEQAVEPAPKEDGPRTAPPDSVLREILKEGPLVE